MPETDTARWQESLACSWSWKKQAGGARTEALLLMVKYLNNADTILDRQDYGMLRHEFSCCVVLLSLKEDIFPVICESSSFQAFTITEC